MKVYIIRELNQYSIYKVPDHLINHFENEKKECIVVDAKSITEVVNKFEAIEKQPECEFNSQVIKYKSVSVTEEECEKDKIRHRQKL
jgi:hypothetical protein